MPTNRSSWSPDPAPTRTATVMSELNAPAARTVLITGAAGGLGRAFALGFAGRGYRVAVADINLEGAEQTAKLVRELGAEAAAFPADVTSVDSTEILARDCADFGNGSIDVVLNNATVYAGVTRSPFEDIDPAFTLTEASYGLMENAENYGVDRGAIKRASQPEEVVGAALFLAGPDSF